MKIGKSVVNFAITASSSCKCKSIDDVPYWSLYSRPGDYIQERIGHQWRSDRAITFVELKQYLERYPYRRLLDAYPRQSAKQRASYTAIVKDDTVDIYDKWTGEVYATFVIRDGELLNTYLADDAPLPRSYYRKLATVSLQ